MKTDRLIDLLSTNVEPIDHRRPSRRVAVAVGVAAALALMPIALGIRHDLASPRALLSFALTFLFSIAALTVAVLSLNKNMRPGGQRDVSLALIWLPFIAVALLAILALAASPSAHWSAMLLGDRWLECLVSIPLIAIVPFAVLTWAVRQAAAPTNLARAGALIGLAAGSSSAAGYALHCTDDTVPFVALWYGTTIALCTLAGAALGPRMLRW